MPSYSERRQILLLAWCNSAVGPILFIWGIYPELETCLKGSDTKIKNDKDLARKYDPLLWAYGSMIFCSFVSGLCTNFAVTVFRKHCDLQIKLGRVAVYLAKALLFQNLAFMFYNLDPLEWRTKDGLLGPWGQIELPSGTCLYSIAVQYYFARKIGKFVIEAENAVKLRQDIVNRVQRNRASN
ncbi:uncharacterized protein LOC110849825 [Folsomia candida]|uniref:uncharacterized protein LOC110849825 n=1 Tax=Folsomia candida TaxID=158441 RepID=UPI000B907B3E|nr:uncharacterized protein LOC110849825 [Folsomia candida]